MDKEFTVSEMDHIMKEIGKMIKWMEKARFSIVIM
jgi:hypothetical protein